MLLVEAKPRDSLGILHIQLLVYLIEFILKRNKGEVLFEFHAEILI